MDLVHVGAPRPEQLANQADSDGELLELWLHGKSPHTIRSYRHDCGRFLAFVSVRLAEVRLKDLQAFADSLTGLAPGSQARCLATVKSLLAFAQKIGYLRFNVGSRLALPVWCG
jgi:integrase/recombinase XerD